MRTSLIVQARMSSTRLPGKVMKTLQGKTFLEHCLDRCHLVPGIDEVICATTDEPDCDIIVDLCRKRGYRWYRGSLTDVLARYYGAAEETHADAVMRITSDCPVADPEIAGQVAERFLAGGYDLVTTNIPPSWPIGLDVEMVSVEALREAYSQARLSSEREHVTPFVRTRPIRYRLSSIACPLEGRAHWRLTLDTEKDLKFFESLAEALMCPLSECRFYDIVAFLDKNPQLLSINISDEFAMHATPVVD